MSRPQIIRPASYALIIQDRSLLLCRLCPPEPAAGKWTLPGGGLDFGESPEDGALRELMEETGLIAALDRLLEVQSQVFSYDDRDMQAIRFIYSTAAWSGSPRNELDGSTDLCAFIPFEALSPDYRHPDYDRIELVDLARRGLELAAGL